METLSIPAELVSFDIKFENDMYSASIMYRIPAGKGLAGSIGQLKSDASWGNFDQARTWIKDKAGIEIK